MIAHPSRARSGITLTEILISILIMGVGLISLATLFPIGLIRLRDAARQSRTALLAESVVGEMGSRNLLDKSTFFQTYYATDPFIVDLNGNGLVAANNLYANQLSGGLPICYDPLWRSVTGILPAPILPNTNFPALPAGTFTPNTFEFRFGTGFSVRPDPDGNPPSAYGLQRITNFVPFAAATSSWPLTYIFPSGSSIAPFTLRDSAESTFVSAEDIVMQNDAPGQEILFNSAINNTGTASPLVPTLFPNANLNTIPEPRMDYKYSWLFTGKQIDVTNGTIFEGDIVIMENRPFGVEPLTVGAGTVNVPSGETVVEAVFGPGNVFAAGYALSASRVVVLRWPNSMPDPEVKTGSWIADVTYERIPTTSSNRTIGSNGTVYPMQRCYWYQIAKKNEAIADPIISGYRQMTVYTATPLRAQTLLAPGGAPVHVNAALIMPSVVNVYSKTFYSR